VSCEWPQVRIVSRLRRRPCHPAQARRPGPTLEHAVADGRRGESEGQVGM